MSGSGNAIIDQILKSSGITSQQYQNYVSNLQQAGKMGIDATGTAAAGTAGQYDKLADLAYRSMAEQRWMDVPELKL